MTDKQIIMDDIDVSECEYHSLNKNDCSLCSLSNNLICSYKPFCYYKQLKRKEQECEGLRYEVGSLENDRDILQDKCDRLKAENEILKEKFEIAIKNNMDKTLLRLENGDVKEELQEIREQFGIETLYCHVDNTRVHRCLDVLKLKDTLTEIKEIVFPKNQLIITDSPIILKIQEKISEVENET